MKTQDVQKIEFERQMLFDFFEEEKEREQELIEVAVKEQIKQNGRLSLADFVQSLSLTHDLPASTVLQFLFWMAIDFKIYFLIDEAVTEPHRVKQLLLQSLEQQVIVVYAENVSPDVLARAKKILRELSADVADASDTDEEDQYQLAASLTRQIRQWQGVLKRHQEAAKKEFFPFAGEIKKALSFIEEVAANLDPCYLLTAFAENQRAILQLPDQVAQISDFYTQHTYFWENVVSTHQEVKTTLSQLLDDSALAADVKKLEQILLAPLESLSDQMVPDRIAEVEQLHSNITGQCRTLLVGQLDKMIVKMKELLAAHQTAPALKNKALYALRTFKTEMEKLTDIPAMAAAFVETEMEFDDLKDEIKT